MNTHAMQYAHVAMYLSHRKISSSHPVHLLVFLRLMLRDDATTGLRYFPKKIFAIVDHNDIVEHNRRANLVVE